jgi:deoxyuridine 5'-triphosphate nucleotidohydrolase
MIKIKKTDLAVYLESKNSSFNFTPKRATQGSAGYDLKACIGDTVFLESGKSFKFPTGINIWLSHRVGDPMLVGLIFPRSSINLKLTNTVGVLDSDYQGEIFLNYKNEELVGKMINPGDRIGQIVFTYACIDELVQVTDFDTKTRRGHGGFGSTGS